MGLFFNDRSFEYETKRALTYASAQGAAIGEIIEICNKIELGNFDSWYSQWQIMANKLEKYADKLTHNGHDKSASDFYLRASNYYRNAEFFCYKTEEKRMVSYEKSVSTFQSAMSLMQLNFEAVTIPYQDYTMNGYLYINHVDAPTLIFIGGYDSTAEELYFAGGFAAIERGYNLLIFDGPGQGGVLRTQNKVAEYDFEKPIAAAIDYLEDYKHISASNFIGLLGMSLGGYYAARAAAFEKRIDACILFDVFTDVWSSIASKNPTLESDPQQYGKSDSHDKWMLQNGLWVFGVDKISQLKEKVEKFNILPVAHQITCPMLLQYGTNDMFVTEDQVALLASELTCDYRTHIFDNEFGGQEHCRAGNSSLSAQVMFDWLDTIVERR